MRLRPLALVLLGACATPRYYEEGDAMPDFSLRDVNPSSATLGQTLSPSDYRGVGSAWYFGHST